MAARFWVGSNGTWDATAGTKWATTSGGAGGAAVPTTSDDVHLDNGTGTGNVTIGINSAVCLSLNCTGYVNTLTITTSNGVTVSGAITLGAGMLTSSDGTGFMNAAATATLTSNGIVVPWGVGFGGTSQTYTLADAWSVASVQPADAGAVTAVTINGNSITTSGNLNLQTAATVSGTTTLIMTGGTWRNTGGGTLKNNLQFNGNVTLDNATLKYNTGTITYTSGTISQQTSTLSLTAATTLNTNGMTWHNITTTVAASTITLSSNLTLDGTFLASAGGFKFAGAFTVNCGDLTISGGAAVGSTMSGNITCSGTFSTSNTGTTPFTGAFTITAFAATVTASQTVTLSGPINVSGLTTFGTGLNTPTINSNTWTTAGLSVSGSTVGGTTSLVIGNSGGTWSGTGTNNLNTTIDVGVSGSLTLTGTVLFASAGTPTLTYTTGIIGGTGTLSVGSACTFAGNAMTLPNMAVTGITTVTLNAPVTITGNLNFPNTAVTFAGTSGYTTGTWTNTNTTVLRVYTHTAGNIYSVTGSFAPSTPSFKIRLQSSSGSVPAVFTVVPGAAQSVANVNATLMDSSAGEAVYDPGGLLSAATNWYNTYPWGQFFCGG